MKKILIASIIGGFGCILLINGYVNGKQEVVELDNTSKTQIEGQISNVSTTTSTIATTKKKATKKVVKTTKKVTTKQVSKSKINISYNRQEVIDYTHQEVVRRWGEKEWNATYKIAMHESGFSPNSWNKKSTACGVFQANPCSKTIKNGYKDYYTNWKTQVQWGLDYIQIKYKTPSNAWEYWQKHHNY